MINAPMPKRGQPAGIARDLHLMKADLAKTLLSIRKDLSRATGHPPGSTRLTRSARLERINSYDDLSKQEELKALTDGELVRLTRQAIAERMRAQKSGEWQPTPSRTPIIEGQGQSAQAPSIDQPPPLPSAPAPSAPAVPPALAAPAPAVGPPVQ